MNSTKEKYNIQKILDEFFEASNFTNDTYDRLVDSLLSFESIKKQHSKSGLLVLLKYDINSLHMEIGNKNGTLLQSQYYDERKKEKWEKLSGFFPKVSSITLQEYIENFRKCIEQALKGDLLYLFNILQILSVSKNFTFKCIFL